MGEREAVLLPPRNGKRKKNYERLVDFAFDPGCVGFCAGVALAAHGCLHLSEAGLSGQGQEGKN
jgi:hypothetical protein